MPPRELSSDRDVSRASPTALPRLPLAGTARRDRHLARWHAPRESSAGTSEIALTGREYSILCALACDPERLFTKDELYTAVWQYRFPALSSRTLDRHVCQLRVKLGRRPWIATVWGVGDRLLPLAPPLAAVSS